MPLKSPFSNSNSSKFLQPWCKKYLKPFGIGLFAFFILIIAYQSEEKGHWFKADLLNGMAQPFDGLVYPLKDVPNWVKVGYNKNSKLYNEFQASDLIPLPEYDLNVLQSDKTDTATQNAKITYSTVYLGNYEMESREEGAGSHPAVDIISPKGNKVYAVGNGVVTLVKNSTGSYGNHIVIRHDQFPDFNDPSKKATYFSYYAHLDKTLIEEGKVVKKGDLIGEVGNTGTATTSHLHFGFDTADAPFHPYWAFSSAEANAAGLSFFEATNAGLGLENAKKYTINPMMYIQQHLNPSSNQNSSPTETQNQTTNPISIPQTGITTPSNVSIPPTTSSPAPSPAESEIIGIDTGLFVFELRGEVSKLANGGGSPLVIVDSLGAMTNLNPDIPLNIEVKGVGEVKPKQLNSNDFKEGKASVYFSSEKEGLSQIEVGKSVHTVNYFNAEKTEPIARLGIEYEGNFEKNSQHEIILRALDINGNPTPSTSFPGAITLKDLEGSATFEPSTLNSQDFKGGMVKIKVNTGNDEALKIKAQSGALVGESNRISLREKKRFSDVPDSHPYALAIYALRDEGVINGYADGTFKPNAPVKRVEALKILMLAAEVNTDNKQANLNFSDIQKQAWYVPTLMAAVNLGIVQGYPDGTFGPENSVNNAEVSKILFESFGVEITEELKANPFSDVSVKDWFAKYAYFINKKNLKEVEGNRYYPSRAATRAEVAGMAYRLKKVLDQNLVTYVE